MDTACHRTRVAIACGGTGGHLFPGLAVAERLRTEGAEVTLLVSSKEIDQQALAREQRFSIVTLPAVGLSGRGCLRFGWEAWRSWRLARRQFASAPPDVLLSMGGFTSAPPALAARGRGAPVVLHEGNAVPGRANRVLARIACRAFVYFPSAADRLRVPQVTVVGMPVRGCFRPRDPGPARVALGLVPTRPVLLVVGGSQGARGVNEAVVRAAPTLVRAVPGLQFLHLSGVRDEAAVRAAYREAGLDAVVCAFLEGMDSALAAADGVIARAGASSLAEVAAMGVPPLLIPYPHAADDHQLANARAVAATGGARVVREDEATPERLGAEVVPLLLDPAVREALRRGLAPWHQADADVQLASGLLELARGGTRVTTGGAALAGTARRPSTA